MQPHGGLPALPDLCVPPTHYQPTYAGFAFTLARLVMLYRLKPWSTHLMFNPGESFLLARICVWWYGDLFGCAGLRSEIPCSVNTIFDEVSVLCIVSQLARHDPIYVKT